MIKIVLYSDIVWEKCADCPNLVKAEVTIGSMTVKICNDCLEDLSSKVSNATSVK
jgi:hypothetical protein